VRLGATPLPYSRAGVRVAPDPFSEGILGYKTERGGTLLDTRGGGRSEVLGGFSYTITAGKLAPMFVNTDSSVWTFFGEVCFSGDPFAVLIRETRGAETKTIGKNDGHTTPYSGRSIKHCTLGKNFTGREEGVWLAPSVDVELH